MMADTHTLSPLLSTAAALRAATAWQQGIRELADDIRSSQPPEDAPLGRDDDDDGEATQPMATVRHG